MSRLDADMRPTCGGVKAPTRVDPTSKYGLGIALALGLVYLVPLYMPPATTVIDLDLRWRPDLGARLFPGVPTAWVGIRLTALALALASLAFAVRRIRPHTIGVAHYDSIPTRPLFVATAFIAALALALVAAVSNHAPARTDVVFAALVPVPLLCTALAYRRNPPRRISASALASSLLFIGWAAWRWTSADGDARIATAVDTWPFYASFIEAVGSARPLLGTRFEPAVPDLIHLLVGAPALSLLEGEASLFWLRAVEMGWLAMATVCVHTLAARIAGGPAAIVAVAGMLFAPFTLYAVLVPSPFGIVVALLSALFLTFHSWITRDSSVALVGLATLGGVASALGHTAVPTAILGAATALSVIARRQRIAAAPLGIAILTALAIAYPSLPRLGQIEQIRASYLDRFQPWGHTEAWLFGQRHISRDLGAPRSDEAMRRVSSALEDHEKPQSEMAMGALLSPIAIPRNALRLCGDVLLEPITAALGCFGLLLLIGRPPAGGTRLPLAFAAIAILPALSTAYDRPSLIRMIGIIPAWSLLAAVAFARLSAMRTNRSTAAAIGAALAIAASGGLLFDRVNPRILAQSWVTVAIDASSAYTLRSVLFEGTELDPYPWMYTAGIGRLLLPERIAVVPIDSPESVRRALRGQPESLYFWSPALEEAADLRAQVCAERPDARMFLLRDHAGLSSAWSATTDPAWQPALAAGQWRDLGRCDDAALPPAPIDEP